MNFLFRLHGSDVFISTEDPTCRYDILCDHCEYPLVDSDFKCPRCQRDLEDCPVCFQTRRRKAVKSEPDAKTGAKTCSVCGVVRIPFGDEPSSKIKGSFCTNLYGCPAGGLLLRSEEFAVLPFDAPVCPICRVEGFQPLDIKTFRYLISSCLFCNTCLGPIPSWPKGWSTREEVALEVGRLEPVDEQAETPCYLCGRHDLLGERGNTVIVRDPQGKDGAATLSDFQYLRLVQLGRALILEKRETKSFRLTFEVWFKDSAGRKTDDRFDVSRAGKLLLSGTEREVVYGVLKARLEPFFEGWKNTVPGGLEFRIGVQGGEGVR